MGFSLDQITAFVAAARLGSFSATARQQRKSQSAVSTAIANLEVDLGLKLFERTSREPVLTEAGRQLLRRAEVLLDQALQMQEQANGFATDATSRITMAIEVPFVAVTSVLHDFAATHPHVALTLRNAMSGDVSEMVRRNEAVLGVAFAQGGYPPDLAFVRMGTLVMVHVARADHPLACLDAVAFADLRAHRHLAFTAHAGKIPTSEYLEAAQTWEAESHSALKELARAGLGWATLPRHLVRDELARGELVELKLEAYPHTEWQVGVDVVWSRTTRLTPAQRWLKERLSSVGLGDERGPPRPRS